ncbi:MAG: hypothetical protein HYV60_05715, partial [Planctomycetia bacterium]|nr:hypothetical protein [Planctomycetia bacterium]
WYGNQPNHFKSQIELGLKNALAALDSANADDAMTQLLALPEKLPKGAAALDLMLLVPGISTLRTATMQSPLVDFLVTISKKDAIASGIRKRLSELRAEHADDLSIGVTESAYLMRMKDEKATEALQALVAAVADHPLEEIQPGRRPNTRQRREGLSHVPLWLIARECLKTKEQQEIGVTLAERALEAARRQTSDQHTAAILYDWGRIALDGGDRDQAEAKWSELLDIVAKRPEPKQPAAKARTSSLDPRSKQSSEASSEGRAILPTLHKQLDLKALKHARPADSVASRYTNLLGVFAPEGLQQISPGQSVAAIAAERRPGSIVDLHTVAVKGRNNEPTWHRTNVAPFQGSRVDSTNDPGRRCAALAAPLCPGLMCDCPYRGEESMCNSPTHLAVTYAETSRSARPTGDKHATKDAGGLVFVNFKANPDDKQPAASRRLPPLTVSQFRLTMEIALAATEN